MGTTLENVAKKVQSLKDRFERLEKDVRRLKDVLNTHDNWNAEIRELLGSEVLIGDRNGGHLEGTLVWSDRYNLCIEYQTLGNGGVTKRIYTKGGINWIEPK